MIVQTASRSILFTETSWSVCTLKISVSLLQSRIHGNSAQSLPSRLAVSRKWRFMKNCCSPQEPPSSLSSSPTPFRFYGILHAFTCRKWKLTKTMPSRAVSCWHTKWPSVSCSSSSSSTRSTSLSSSCKQGTRSWYSLLSPSPGSSIRSSKLALWPWSTSLSSDVSAFWSKTKKTSLIQLTETSREKLPSQDWSSPA